MWDIIFSIVSVAAGNEQYIGSCFTEINWLSGARDL